MDVGKVHKIGIFLFGVVSLALYLSSYARQEVGEAAEAKKRQEKTRPVPQKKKIVSYLILFGLICGLWVFAIVMHKVIISVGPDFESKINKFILESLFKIFLYGGEYLSGDQTFFSQERGIMILEWLLVLSPYILGFIIWTLREVRRD